jgi:hypothetical protein
MRQRYSICLCCKDSTTKKCPLSFKINYCQKSDHIEIFEESDKTIDCVSLGINTKPCKPSRGVATIVRELIEQMCLENAEETAKRVLTRLIRDRKDKKLFDKTLIPSLKQVSIFVVSIFSINQLNNHQLRFKGLFEDLTRNTTPIELGRWKIVWSRINIQPMVASEATYNASKIVFPEAKNLMCYFDLCQNVRKNCRAMFHSEEQLEELQDIIYNLHVAKSHPEYLERVEAFRTKYKTKRTRKVYDYMCKQWIDNHRFNKWQIYHSPPGFANTNSNIESFNRQIKGFTQKRKLSIFGMVDKCCEMVQYYSTEQGERWNIYPKFSTKLNEASIKLDKGSFKKIAVNKFSFKKWVINKTEKKCSCRGFCKHAICQHSLAFSHMLNLEWFGTQYTSRSCEFVYKNKHGRKKGRRYKKASSALTVDSD